jgi:phosphomannomutase
MDGTLTPNTQPVSASVLKRLKKLQGTYKLYLVTGSNYEKVEKQFKWNNVTNLFERVFCCNGTMVYQTTLDSDDEFGNLEPDMIHKVVLTDHYSQSDLNYLISILLKYAYKNHTKFKTGTFVEWRDSQINFSLIGRNCSQVQRDDYVKWDRKSGDRDKAIKFLEEKFKSYGLSFRKGGQISIDISRQQWSKAYAFENIKEAPEDCVFFGDNIVPVGNDWEIAKMCGKFHAVEDPKHLLEVLKEY